MPEHPMNGMLMWLKSSNWELDKPCQDGERLYEWLDEANSNHAQQPDTGKQPCYQWNIIQPHPAVYFAGEQFFEVAAGALQVASASDRSFFHVYKFATVPPSKAPGVVLRAGSLFIQYVAHEGGLQLLLRSELGQVISKPFSSSTGIVSVLSTKENTRISLSHNGAPLPVAILAEGSSNATEFSETVSSSAFFFGHVIWPGLCWWNWGTKQ